MKKLFSFLMCLGLMGLAFAFSGCGGVDLYMYIYAGEYKRITSSTSFEEEIKDLEINWLAGELKVIAGDVDKITLTETGEKVEDKPGYYRLTNDGHLDIEYFKSGEVRDPKIIKNLTITIPRSYNFMGIDINTTHGNVYLDGVVSNTIKLIHTNGNSLVKNSTFEMAKVITKVGFSNITNSVVQEDLILNPNEGKVEVTSCNVKDYIVYTYKGEITLTMPDESFALTIDPASTGRCNHEDFEIVDGVYGDRENILHTISFSSTHSSAVLNLVKLVV